MSDQPFTIRDIQFNQPQVWILIAPALQVFVNFLWFINILLA